MADRYDRRGKDRIARLPGVEDGFEGLYARSQGREADGVGIRLASIDDLLAMKGTADRDKDREVERQLRAVRRILEEPCRCLSTGEESPPVSE